MRSLMTKAALVRCVVLGLLVWQLGVSGWARAEEAKKEAEAPAAAAAAPAPAPSPPFDPSKPAPDPDPTGASYTGASTTGQLTLDNGKVTNDTLTRDVALIKINTNMVWLMLGGFLVMFMQCGFALLETGLCRAKNAAHTMGMNFVVYATGMLGFWICGYAFQMGGVGPLVQYNGPDILHNMVEFNLFHHPFKVLGYTGFFLAGSANDMSVLGMFLFQMVFMDTAATIPTGAMAERWKFSSFTIYGFFMSMIIYPIFACWVWGGGWLSQLGANWGLGNGHLDFAGSSVVHMTGGITALAGAIILGPRLGKFNKDGSSNAIPGHNIPMVVVGTLILAFGWFGFNAGSTTMMSDGRLAGVAVNTMLASAAGCFSSLLVMWTFFGKPDPTMGCNGLLAGLVAITASCAFVNPIGAVLLGTIAGVIVVGSVLFVERILKVDDPVGAVSVHGVCGAWGCLSIGFFADGKYGAGLNLAPGSTLTPTGLFYGGGVTQLLAEMVGVATNFIWVFTVAITFFWVLDKLHGNRVTARAEIEGLDIHEMGVPAYVNEDAVAVQQAGEEFLATFGPSAVPTKTEMNGKGGEVAVTGRR